jgi:hypothetical protein
MLLASLLDSGKSAKIELEGDMDYKVKKAEKELKRAQKRRRRLGSKR